MNELAALQERIGFIDSKHACHRYKMRGCFGKKEKFVTIVFIDEVEGFKRRIIYEAVGRVYNPALEPRHRREKRYLTTSLVEIKDQTF